MLSSKKWTLFLPWLIGVAAIAVRLIDLNAPFIDTWSWRQCDVAAIARNFLHNGYCFAWPQIDWAGNAPGFVGTEFPLLPYAVALVYDAVGVHEWVGRLETICFFALSLPFFFALVRRAFGELAARWALFFYSFAPLGIEAGRAFMPDMPSLSLSVIGLYCFLRWRQGHSWRSFLTAALTIALAILLKATTAIIGLPLLYLSVISITERGGNFDRGRRPRLHELILFALIALVPAALWYWHAWEIARTNYPYHFFGAGGFSIMSWRWYGGIFWRTATISLTPVLFILMLAGALTLPRRPGSRLFHWWLVAMIGFIIAVGYGNRHPWYQLPLVPIAASLAGLFCQECVDRLRAPRVVRQFSGAFLAVIFAVAVFFNARTYFAASSSDLRETGLALQRITPPTARIVAVDDGDPALLYYAQRTGWHFLEKQGIWQGPPRDGRQAIADLERLRRQGAHYIAFPLRTRWWLDYYRELAVYLNTAAVPVEVTPRFAIYRLPRSGGKP